MTNSLVGSVERPLASQLPATYTLSASREACDKNLKNQTRTRFIQLKLTTAVKSKVMESFQGGRERQTASPWGPCCRNRVFRRPLSGCQESGWTPYPPPIYPPTLHDELITGLGGGVTRWGDEGCDTVGLSESWQQIVASCPLGVCLHNDDSICSRFVKDADCSLGFSSCLILFCLLSLSF